MRGKITKIVLPYLKSASYTIFYGSEASVHYSLVLGGGIMTQMNTQKVIEKIEDFNKLTTELTHRVQNCLLEIINETVAINAKQLENLSKVKKPEEVVELQMHALDEIRNQMMKSSQRVFNLSLANMTEINKWMASSGYVMNPFKMGEKKFEKDEGSSGKK
jgi:hypothetical protein